MFRDPESPRSLHWSQIGRGLDAYVGHVREFRRNARLYLAHTVLTGVAFGIFRLLFNFYALGLGYDESFLGTLITVSSLAALLAALPAAWLSDRLGRRPALVAASLGMTLSTVGMVLFPERSGLLAMSVLQGLAQSLGGVTLGPFLMENSSERERTYLFSFSMGLQMVAGFAGNWLGGRLPAWLGAATDLEPTSAAAYALSLLAVAAIALASAAPLALMSSPARPGEQKGPYLSPFAFARRQPALLWRLVSPMLVTSLGAGLFMPFMNVFFRTVHGSSDAAIGSLFALGSLSMAVGFLVAPPLADRYGKVTFVVVTQALSIPFMLALGFSPLLWIGAGAYLARLGLMNMSNPVYQTFVMERVEPEARATVASLTSMAWNVGWAFSPTISGWLQVHHGFRPVFSAAALVYCLAIFMYFRFFWHDRHAGPS